MCGCVYYSTNKAKKITLLKKHLLEQPESPDSNDKCRIQTCVFDDAEQCSVIDLGSFLSLQLKCLSKSNIRILSIEQCSDLPQRVTGEAGLQEGLVPAVVWDLLRFQTNIQSAGQNLIPVVSLFPWCALWPSDRRLQRQYFDQRLFWVFLSGILSTFQNTGRCP